MWISDWIQGFKNYITSNNDNTYARTIATTDKILAFKEQAAANAYARVYSLQNLIDFMGNNTFSNVSELTYNGYNNIIKCDSVITNPIFSWTITGEPLNMKFSDNLGMINEVDITGTSYESNVTYSLSEFGQIIHTISGENITDATLTTTFVHESYYGTNETGQIPTASQIIATAERLVTTNTGVTFPIVTTTTEFGWIAVPQSQTGKTYTNWEVTSLNAGEIGINNFIAYKGEVTIHLDTYDVYMFTNPIDFNSNLTLS